MSEAPQDGAPPPFIEVDWFNRRKFRKVCSGDVFLSERLPDGSVVAVLTDGLGSGQQANVCASLTATMAMAYMRAALGLRRAATLIMDALPICPDRHISYSTFTMIRADPRGEVRMIEYENPPATLLHGDTPCPIERTPYTLPRWEGRTLSYSTFQMGLGDRLFFCSDGITQAGLGAPETPFGQGLERVVPWLREAIRIAPDVGSHVLCKGAADRATRLDGGRAGDDTTAAMLHYRRPRVTQMLTAPSIPRSPPAPKSPASTSSPKAASPSPRSSSSSVTPAPTPASTPPPRCATSSSPPTKSASTSAPPSIPPTKTPISPCPWTSVATSSRSSPTSSAPNM